MEIEITKTTEDIRENRKRTLKKGTKMVCTKELAEKYIKLKLAKEVVDSIRPTKAIRNEEDLERHFSV
jgi:hypothetical protein